MTTRPPFSVLLLTVVGFCILYAPQPLLPSLAAHFDIGPGAASLAITLTMLPLAMAPLLYGYILEGLDARRMLLVSTLLLAVGQLGAALAEDWSIFLGWRLWEGLVLPALYTALMTYVAGSVPREQVRQAMGWYIAATLIGGFSGRAISGLVADVWDWQWALGLWVPILMVMALAMLQLPGDQRSHFGRLDTSIFREVLAIPGVAVGYLAIFCVFFIFAALLNVLPFRMTALQPDISMLAIGLAYAGYLSGLLVTLNAGRFAVRLGSERRVYRLGLLFYGSGLLIFALPSIGGVHVAMLVFCAGMFLLHTRLSGQLNHLGHERRGVVNGIYIASYYFGGALGSWLPAVLYRQTSWLFFLAVLASMLLLAGWSLQHMLRQISAVD